jgi:trehalose/maltose hydrolase-like predicted phosphorylase
MVAWVMEKAFGLWEGLSEEDQKKLSSKINLGKDEFENWKEISSKLNIVIKDEILAQYDGYFELKELDWNYFREKYGNIYRMDRLLKAEGKTADEYKVAKQADTLMTFYNLPEEEVTKILNKLGYNLKADYLRLNMEYYLQRTSHGSTLSRVVHAQLANMIGDKKLSWELYSDALSSDYNDIQGGTTGEGIHAGVMAGTVLVALQTYAGVDVRSGKLIINPNLPDAWRKLSFNFNLKEDHFEISVRHDRLDVRFTGPSRELEIVVNGAIDLLPEGIATIYALQ